MTFETEDCEQQIFPFKINDTNIAMFYFKSGSRLLQTYGANRYICEVIIPEDSTYTTIREGFFACPKIFLKPPMDLRDIETKEYIVESSDPTSGDKEWFPLLQTVSNYDIDMMELLIKHGDNVNAKAVVDGQSALRRAAASNKGDMCRLLLENGADVNIQDKNNYTPMWWAKSNNSFKAIEVLREYHAKER